MITMLFFTKNYLKKFYCRIYSLFGDKKKTVKNGITVVIICKLFDIIKSYITILFVDCNTHLHGLSKKQKIFECCENKGGGHQVGKNAIF